MQSSWGIGGEKWPRKDFSYSKSASACQSRLKNEIPALRYAFGFANASLAIALPEILAFLSSATIEIVTVIGRLQK